MKSGGLDFLPTQSAVISPSLFDLQEPHLAVQNFHFRRSPFQAFLFSIFSK